MADEGVTYSFKELFDNFNDSLTEGFRRLDHRLDEINGKIDSKADNSRVAALEAKHADYETRIEGRFGGMDKRFKPLEDFVLTNAATATLKGRQLAFLSALTVAIVGSFVYVALSGRL